MNEKLFQEFWHLMSSAEYNEEQVKAKLKLNELEFNALKKRRRDEITKHHEEEFQAGCL